MTCPRHDELSAYADLVMKPGERARFDQHLQACPICQLQLEDLQALRQGLPPLWVSTSHPVWKTACGIRHSAVIGRGLRCGADQAGCPLG